MKFDGCHEFGKIRGGKSNRGLKNTEPNQRFFLIGISVIKKKANFIISKKNLNVGLVFGSLNRTEKSNFENRNNFRFYCQTMC